MSFHNLTHQHRHRETGNPWLNCTLCRSHSQSVSVFEKASQRKVKWPEPKKYSQSPIEDPTVYTSIDDAFSSVMQSLSTTSRLCKRFYKSCPDRGLQSQDRHHCNRFHSAQYTRALRTNPLQTAEDVHMIVHPGTYAVTAGEWGTTRQQTHVVHVEQGQNVNLDFVM